MGMSEFIKERKPSISLPDLITQLKFKVKVLYKSIIRRTHHLPYKQIEFSALDSIDQTKKHKGIYNHFEHPAFKLLLEKGNLIGYKKNIVWNGKVLPLEGEDKKAYRINNSHITNTPDVYCYSLSNAGITGPEGYIYDVQSRKYISETLRQWFVWDSRFKNSYLSSLRSIEPVCLQGVTLCIAKPGSDSYFHFLHESLTIFLLMQQRFSHVKFNNIVVNGTRQTYKDEWVKFAGAENINIIYTDYSSHFVCEQLIFLSDLCFQYSPNLLTVNLLTAMQKKNKVMAEKKYPEIIIASRKDAHYRNISWEEELAEKCGAAVIQFSKLTPEEVMETCSNCRVFIGAHGAAFSNIVFCKAGTKIIEIIFGLNEVLYSRLSDVCQLNHLIFDVSQKEELFGFLGSLQLKSSRL
jgi:hypothetical protein